MDSAKEFTTIEWCAGYGGIQLGLRRAIPNLRTIAYSEIEAFAAANLVAKMEAGLLDAAPTWTDLKTFPCQEFRDRVDLLVAGYPCQPFSAAGKRQGKDDPRHLWPFIRKAIGIIRPKFCFFENVEGHITLGLREVLADLRSLGYRVENDRQEPTWGIFSAEECGAPHRRKRVFILAKRLGDSASASAGGLCQREKPQTTGFSGSGEPSELADNSSARLQRVRQRSEQEGWQAQAGHTGSCGQVWPSRPGQQQHEWEPPRVMANNNCRCGETGDKQTRWQAGPDVSGRSEQAIVADKHSNRCDEGRECVASQGSNGAVGENGRQTQPPLGRNADGPTDWLVHAELYESCDNRTDELRLLGNGVVPATAELAWRTLHQRLTRNPDEEITP